MSSETSKILLRKDARAMHRRRPLLKDVPYYETEGLLHHPGVQIPNTFFAAEGGGSIGIRFCSNIAQNPVFAKIWDGSNIPAEIMRNFLYRTNVDQENLKYVPEDNTDSVKRAFFDEVIEEHERGDYWELEEMRLPESQAAGFKLAKFLLPRKVPALRGVLTYNSRPVGHLTDAIKGKVVNLKTEPDEAIDYDCYFLGKYGIELDAEEKNGIKVPNGELMYVDLLYQLDVHNPLPHDIAAMYRPYFHEFRL